MRYILTPDYVLESFLPKKSLKSRLERRDIIISNKKKFMDELEQDFESWVREQEFSESVKILCYLTNVLCIIVEAPENFESKLEKCPLLKRVDRDQEMKLL